MPNEPRFKIQNILCEFLGKLLQKLEYSLNIQGIFATLYAAVIQVSELYTRNMRISSIAVVKREAEMGF
jgi:hypothetical protein